MTPAITRADLRALIAANVENTTLADDVAGILMGFDGKTVTKRMATAVEKAMPERTVHYGTEYGMKQISIWGAEIAYDKRSRFLLTYDSHSQVFSIERFVNEYNRAYYGAAQERNQKRATKLKDLVWQSKVVDAINALNSARGALTELVCFPLPDEHVIMKLVEGK